jgi:hypothetical protein
MGEETVNQLSSDSENEQEKPKTGASQRSNDSPKENKHKNIIQEERKEEQKVIVSEPPPAPKEVSPEKPDTRKTFWELKQTPRKTTDFLHIEEEDFSKNRSINVEGIEITPSSFNIMRDSLKKNMDITHEILLQNLPDLNLESASEVSDDEDIVPLDFRTKLI